MLMPPMVLAAERRDGPRLPTVVVWAWSVGAMQLAFHTPWTPSWQWLVDALRLRMG